MRKLQIGDKVKSENNDSITSMEVINLDGNQALCSYYDTKSSGDREGKFDIASLKLVKAVVGGFVNEGE